MLYAFFLGNYPEESIQQLLLQLFYFHFSSKRTLSVCDTEQRLLRLIQRHTVGKNPLLLHSEIARQRYLHLVPVKVCEQNSLLCSISIDCYLRYIATIDILP